MSETEPVPQEPQEKEPTISEAQEPFASTGDDWKLEEVLEKVVGRQ